jgi:hypothetical protein
MNNNQPINELRADQRRMQRLVSLFEKVGFEMLPTGNGKFIVEDPTGGDGLEKLGDQFASLPRYEIDTSSGNGRMQVKEHNDNILLTKVWPQSKAVNTMIIDRKEAETLVKELRKLLKTAENIEN